MRGVEGSNGDGKGEWKGVPHREVLPVKTALNSHYLEQLLREEHQLSKKHTDCRMPEHGN